MVKLKCCFILLAIGLATANAAAVVKVHGGDENLIRRNDDDFSPGRGKPGSLNEVHPGIRRKSPGEDGVAASQGKVRRELGRRQTGAAGTAQQGAERSDSPDPHHPNLFRRHDNADSPLANQAGVPQSNVRRGGNVRVKRQPQQGTSSQGGSIGVGPGPAPLPGPGDGNGDHNTGNGGPSNHHGQIVRRQDRADPPLAKAAGELLSDIRHGSNTHVKRHSQLGGGSGPDFGPDPLPGGTSHPGPGGGDGYGNDRDDDPSHHHSRIVRRPDESVDLHGAPPHPPGEDDPGHHLYQLFRRNDEHHPKHAKSFDEFKSMVFQVADQQMDPFFATRGYCAGPNSRLCRDNVCELGTSGCRAYTAKEKEQMTRMTEQMWLRLVSTGKCTTEADESDRKLCSKHGFCQFYDANGHTPKYCRAMVEKEYYEASQYLRLREDGSFDLVDEVDDADLEGKQQQQRRLEKRDRTSTHFILARDVFEGLAWLGPSSPGMAKRDVLGSHGDVGTQKQESLRSGQQLSEDLGSEDQEILSLVSTYISMQETMESTAIQSALRLDEQTGVCDSNAFGCENGRCEHVSPACKPASRSALSKAKKMYKDVGFKLLRTGKCIRSPETKSFCNKAGYCNLITEDSQDQTGCQLMDDADRKTFLGGLKVHPGSWTVGFPGEDEQDQSPSPKMAESEEGLSEDVSLDHVAASGTRQKRAYTDNVSADDRQTSASGDGGADARDQYTDSLAREALQMADKRIADIQKKKGICQPGSSASSDCETLTEEEVHGLRLYYGMRYGQLLITGSCTPTSDNAPRCNSWGFCIMMLSQNNGTDPDCKPLHKDQQTEVLKLLQLRNTYWDFPSDADQPLAEDSSSIPTHTTNSGFKAKRGVPDSADYQPPLTKSAIAVLEDAQAEAANLANAQIEHNTEGLGRCETTTSESCNDGICKLDSPGCQPYSEQDKNEMYEYYTSIFTKILLSGKCTPPSNGDYSTCSRYGYCNLVFDQHRHECNLMTEDEHQQLIETVQKVEDPNALFPEDHGHSTSPGGGGAKVKRDLSSYETGAGAEDAASIYLKSVQAEADSIADKAAERSAKTSGMCKEESSTCHSGLCDLGSPDCEQMDEATKTEMREYFSTIVAKILMTGTCHSSTAHGDDGGCNQAGYCNIVDPKTGLRNRGCKDLNLEQRRHLIESLEYTEDGTASIPGGPIPSAPPSTSSAPLGAKVKRDSTTGSAEADHSNYKTVRFNPSETSLPSNIVEPTQEEVDEFMALCSRLEHDREALDSVAEAAGVEDEAEIQRLGQRFAQLSTDEHASYEALKHAKQVQMLAESKTSPATTIEGSADKYGPHSTSENRTGGVTDDDHGEEKRNTSKTKQGDAGSTTTTTTEEESEKDPEKDVKPQQEGQASSAPQSKNPKIHGQDLMTGRSNGAGLTPNVDGSD